MEVMFRALLLDFFGGPLLLPLVIAYVVAVLVAAITVVRGLVQPQHPSRNRRRDPSAQG
jgi:hypothetical protein